MELGQSCSLTSIGGNLIGIYHTGASLSSFTTITTTRSSTVGPLGSLDKLRLEVTPRQTVTKDKMDNQTYSKSYSLAQLLTQAAIQTEVPSFSSEATVLELLTEASLTQEEIQVLMRLNITFKAISRLK